MRIITPNEPGFWKFNIKLLQRVRKVKLENMLKILENNLTESIKEEMLTQSKCDLDEIYDKLANVIRILSRCNKCKKVKNKPFFSHFGKIKSSHGKIYKLFESNQEVTDLQKIEHKIFFFQNLFQSNIGMLCR